MNTVWITGSNGLIGRQLAATAPALAKNFRVRALTRADFDLLDFSKLETEFFRDKPALILHCAAVSTIAGAHENPALARRVNVELTQFLAELARDAGFVLFSTDLVFDGRKGNYRETDAANPLQFYGETKLAAEQIVLKNPRHLVVRTSINGGKSPAGNRGFNEQLRSSLQKAGRGMTLFRDEFRCPIAAVETARAVWDLAQKNCAGLYHVTGAEKLSRLEIGQLLVKRWPEVTAELKSGSARDFPGPPRAPDLSLDIGKAQRVLTRPLPRFSDWLAANPSEYF